MHKADGAGCRASRHHFAAAGVIQNKDIRPLDGDEVALTPNGQGSNIRETHPQVESVQMSDSHHSVSL